MDHFIDNLVEFYEKLSSWEHAVVKGGELSLQQMHTVEVVGNSSEIRMKELAEKLSVTTGTLTVMVQRLEKMKILERKRSEKDARSFCISLTKKGRALYDEHHRLHAELSEEISSALEVNEIEEFNRLLEKVIRSF